MAWHGTTQLHPGQVHAANEIAHHGLFPVPPRQPSPRYQSQEGEILQEETNASNHVTFLYGQPRLRRQVHHTYEPSFCGGRDGAIKTIYQLGAYRKLRNDPKTTDSAPERVWERGSGPDCSAKSQPDSKRARTFERHNTNADSERYPPNLCK